MDGLLFDPTEYTDERIRTIMEGKTCRTCGNRHRSRAEFGNSYYCIAHSSNLTNSGHLKVKANQPACIRYTAKQPDK